MSMEWQRHASYLEAFGQGYHHRVALGLRCECPYMQGSRAHYGWNRGYACAVHAERQVPAFYEELVALRTDTMEG